jgi:molybdopterin-guanine dinucleotide biosynthesis protein A
MGQDKARLSLGGQSFVERVSAAVSAISPRVCLVGGVEPEPGSNHGWIPDLHPGWGALGGLETALAACEADWAAVVACDLPFVTGALFTRLAAMRENCDAIIPIQTDGRPQPLCALYYKAACADLAGRLVGLGERRPRALLSQVRTRWVAHDELADLDRAERFFLNINTPEDLEQAVQAEE